MKNNTTKLYTAAAFLLLSISAYAQEGRVGVNTTTPAATLDVVASPNINTRIDGFIAPRLTGNELQAKDALYTNDQDATIIYATAPVTTATDKTFNVTSIGYYYFDKTQGTAGRWMKIANPSAAAAYQEPWNVQGTTTPATLNSQDIFQSGTVAIGKNAVYNSTIPARLDVMGPIRSGNLQQGVVGTNSAAFGFQNEASATRAFAAGGNNVASGQASIALGQSNTTSAQNSFALGWSNNISAAESGALGYQNTVSGSRGYAIGQGNDISGNNGTIGAGLGISLSGSQEIGLGKYNAITDTSGALQTNALLQVGNGTTAARSNAITVLRNSHTAIGVAGTGATAKPTELLDLGGNATAGDGGLKIRNINSAAYTGNVSSDKLVVADADGVLKTVGPLQLFTGAKKFGTFTWPANTNIGNTNFNTIASLVLDPNKTYMVYAKMHYLNNVNGETVNGQGNGGNGESVRSFVGTSNLGTNNANAGGVYPINGSYNYQFLQGVDFETTQSFIYTTTSTESTLYFNLQTDSPILQRSVFNTGNSVLYKGVYIEEVYFFAVPIQ